MHLLVMEMEGFKGAPEVPPLCRETSVSRTANFGTWLRKRNGGQKWVNEDRVKQECQNTLFLLPSTGKG